MNLFINTWHIKKKWNINAGKKTRVGDTHLHVFFPCVEQLNGFSIYHFDYNAYTFKLKDILYITNLSIYTENTS